jgi:hypothetical protein
MDVDVELSVGSSIKVFLSESQLTNRLWRLQDHHTLASLISTNRSSYFLDHKSLAAHYNLEHNPP